MKLIIRFITAMTIPLLAACSSPPPNDGDSALSSYANNNLLPSPFPVYSNGQIVVNHPVAGFRQILIPTVNAYNKPNGCYVMCYSHNSKNGLYKVSSDIYAIGQIRVPGQYQNGICIPKNYADKDISAATHFKKLCTKQISACNKGGCWAGGGTGGWFGMQ
jgi:hypothetical protein